MTVLNKHQNAFVKLFKSNCHRHADYRVFSDFCEISAIALSNAVDKTQFEEREKRYFEIIADYKKDELKRFAEMLSHVTDSLESGMHDCLGELFMDLELSSHWKGQYFTPYSLCKMMALMVFEPETAIKQKGFVTLNEPAAGAGAMVVAYADSMKDKKINYQQHLHATAMDIDTTAVHMAYIQLSLCGIPATVLHGNALSNEVWGHWFTPMHVLGNWNMRLRFDRATTEAHELITMEDMDEPAKEVVRDETLTQLQEAVHQEAVQRQGELF